MLFISYFAAHVVTATLKGLSTISFTPSWVQDAINLSRLVSLVLLIVTFFFSPPTLFIVVVACDILATGYDLVGLSLQAKLGYSHKAHLLIGDLLYVLLLYMSLISIGVFAA